MGQAWTMWLVTRGQWRVGGRLSVCRPRAVLPDLGLRPALEQAANAKAICATCRVRRECPAFALRTGQNHGIWAERPSASALPCG